MIEKLRNQKNRAENLKYSDRQELDDIIRKTKLYLEQLFPNKVGYPFEVSDIKFKPSTTVYSMDDTQEKNCIKSWNDGKNGLINLIDTRIEEYELLDTKKDLKFQKPVIKERIVEVENTDKINQQQSELNQLRKELNQSKNKKSLWNKINWTAFLTIGIAILGGTFLFGKYIGENRFDKEKIELNSRNERLINENSNLYDSIKIMNKSLRNNQIIQSPTEEK